MPYSDVNFVGVLLESDKLRNRSGVVGQHSNPNQLPPPAMGRQGQRGGDAEARSQVVQSAPQPWAPPGVGALYPSFVSSCETVPTAAKYASFVKKDAQTLQQYQQADQAAEITRTRAAAAHQTAQAHQQVEQVRQQQEQVHQQAEQVRQQAEHMRQQQEQVRQQVEQVRQQQEQIRQQVEQAHEQVAVQVAQQQGGFPQHYFLNNGQF